MGTQRRKVAPTPIHRHSWSCFGHGGDDVLHSLRGDDAHDIHGGSRDARYELGTLGAAGGCCGSPGQVAARVLESVSSAGSSKSCYC